VTLCVPGWLDRAADSHPDRHAVETPEGALTYAELADASRTALPAGEQVAIALPAGLDFAIALHACLRSGAIAVPVDLRLAPAEQARICAGAEVVIDAPMTRGRPADAASRDPVARSDPSAGSDSRPGAGPLTGSRPVHGSDPGWGPGHDLGATAAVIHTSGTSGRPKPIELTYGNWLWSALGSATAIGLDPAERWLCTLPLAHVGGLSILIRSAIYATTAVLHPRFDAGAVLRALNDEAITVISLVPTTLARLLDAGLESPPALRCALIGGAPAAPALLARARDVGIVAVATYGLTEACSQVTTQLPGDLADDSGRPLFCTRVRIRDGEIQVAGPTVARRPAEAHGGEPEWLSTGDVGELVDGRLRVTGRRSEMIVSGGENIAPIEVEDAVCGHPAVAEAAAISYAHAEWGEAVRVFVVLVTDAQVTDQELRDHCRRRLAGFKVPKEFVRVDALPRTPSGKLARRELRGPAASREPGAGREPDGRD
jgi:O-succinylbenzoic acid--CoA ligase